MRYVVQTRSGRRYTELFESALRAAPFEEFACAVAYATIGGVRTLDHILERELGDKWAQMRKQWLVGIDWCRTDPPALKRLAAMPKSQVKIPNGSDLLDNAWCTPRDTFHPKLFVFSAPTAHAVICGSGNLSANGLSRGCEIGSLLLIGRKSKKETTQEVNGLIGWVQDAWRQADDFSSVIDQYESICRNRVKARRIVPTDDDNRPPEEAGANTRRALTEEQIRQFRTFDNFWIDGGALGANLGRGIPGNQLDMKRFTRAFFGTPIENVARNREIDQITLIWDGEPYVGRTLKFGDNQMDKLNVPPASDRGPLFYQGKTLLFARRSDGAFDFAVGDQPQRRVWREQSKRHGVIHRLSQSREWGLF